MADVDYHAQCDSYVRLSPEDLAGPFDHVWALEDNFHPASTLYPDVKVESCELAAGHDGLCEAFIDSTGINPGEQSLSHWIAWQRDPKQLPTAYEWITSENGCNAQSPHEHWCIRPEDHSGGHSFTAT